MENIFLGVERSISGRCWTGPNIAVDRKAEMIIQENNFPNKFGEASSINSLKLSKMVPKTRTLDIP